MKRPAATHVMRRTDYLPAYYGGRPVWLGVYRARRTPRRDGEHWIFVCAGKTRHAEFLRATAKHWLVRLYRSSDRPKAITRLARARWSPTWNVRATYFQDPTVVKPPARRRFRYDLAGDCLVEIPEAE
jgi:hypothetical protein